MTVRIKNTGSAAALMIKLTLDDAATGQRILPAYYSENYVSLLPGEERTVTVAFRRRRKTSDRRARLEPGHADTCGAVRGRFSVCVLLPGVFRVPLS